MSTNVPSNVKANGLVVELYNEAHPDNDVPFAILASVLEDMQQAFYLLALQHEKREIQERARIPSEVERRYVLRASIPKQGSYALPATLGDPYSELFVPEDIEAVSNSFHSFMQAVATSDDNAIRDIVQDRQLRRRVLGRVRSMIPKPGSGWGLRLKYDGRDSIQLAKQAYHEITQILKKSDSNTVASVVTGELVKIHFDSHEIILRYPVTRRELTCYYDASIEERLLESRRELIQIIGSVTLDENDNPTRITDVIDIVDIDLSAFQLSEFKYPGRILRFREPIEISPTLDDSQQVFCLEHEPLGIDIYASTREELDMLLWEEIDVLWRNYAVEDSDRLTPDAQELKQYLLEAIEEINNAT
jgi:hypothetical protein